MNKPFNFQDSEVLEQADRLIDSLAPAENIDPAGPESNVEVDIIVTQEETQRLPPAKNFLTEEAEKPATKGSESLDDIALLANQPALGGTTDGQIPSEVLSDNANESELIKLRTTVEDMIRDQRQMLADALQKQSEDLAESYKHRLEVELPPLIQEEREKAIAEERLRIEEEIGGFRATISRLEKIEKSLRKKLERSDSGKLLLEQGNFELIKQINRLKEELRIAQSNTVASDDTAQAVVEEGVIPSDATITVDPEEPVADNGNNGSRHTTLLTPGERELPRKRNWLLPLAAAIMLMLGGAAGWYVKPVETQVITNDSTLQAKLDALQSDIDAGRSRESVLTAQVSTAQAEIDRLKPFEAKYTTAQAALNDADNVIPNLTAQVATLTNDKKALEDAAREAKTDTDGKLAERDATIATQTTRLSELEGELQTVQTAKSETDQQVATLNATVTETNGTITQQQEQIDALTLRAETAEATVEANANAAPQVTAVAAPVAPAPVAPVVTGKAVGGTWLLAYTDVTGNLLGAGNLPLCVGDTVPVEPKPVPATPKPVVAQTVPPVHHHPQPKPVSTPCSCELSDVPQASTVTMTDMQVLVAPN